MLYLVFPPLLVKRRLSILKRFCNLKPTVGTSTNSLQDFVLLDVRGEALYQQGHIAGALNIPYGRLNEKTLASLPIDRLIVVYCAGPHCNATEKAAIRLAKLGRPVKKMIGGVTGWVDEGFSLRSE